MLEVWESGPGFIKPRGRFIKPARGFINFINWRAINFINPAPFFINLAPCWLLLAPPGGTGRPKYAYIQAHGPDL